MLGKWEVEYSYRFKAVTPCPLFLLWRSMSPVQYTCASKHGNTFTYLTAGLVTVSLYYKYNHKIM